MDCINDIINTLREALTLKDEQMEDFLTVRNTIRQDLQSINESITHCEEERVAIRKAIDILKETFGQEDSAE